jgi:hypothetical protein
MNDDLSGILWYIYSSSPQKVIIVYWNLKNEEWYFSSEAAKVGEVLGDMAGTLCVWSDVTFTKILDMGIIPILKKRPIGVFAK